MKLPSRLLSALIVAGSLLAFAATGTVDDPTSKATSYLVGRQTPTGAFFNAKAPADGVAEVVQALVAGDGDQNASERALAYLSANGPERARAQAGYSGRLIMGIRAAGHDPGNFGGFDYVATLEGFFDTESGAYDSASIYGNALALLGVAASGRPLPVAAADYMRRNECPTGGFSHRPLCGLPPDIDTTALALNALTATGLSPSDPIISRARNFLRANQNSDGGFPHDPYSLERPTNSNSTGLVLSAIASLHEDPSTWMVNEQTPRQALLGLQHSSGGFGFTDASSPNDYATVQAVPGSAGVAYPVDPRRVASHQSPATAGPQHPARGIQQESPSEIPSNSRAVNEENSMQTPSHGAGKARLAAIRGIDERPNSILLIGLLTNLSVAAAHIVRLKIK